MAIYDVAASLRAAMAAVALAAIAAAVPGAMAQSVVTGAQESAGEAVQIEADQMEVDQDEHRATFTGNVDAVQGNMRMRSDALSVHYEEVPDGSGTKTDVTRLDARGNVVVTSKGQTVTAQWARMDMRANTVQFGDAVTVTDGRTVLRGRELHLNLTTGESRLVGGNDRVQGTFFRSDN